jgi:hypothetical protein
MLLTNASHESSACDISCSSCCLRCCCCSCCGGGGSDADGVGGAALLLLLLLVVVASVLAVVTRLRRPGPSQHRSKHKRSTPTDWTTVPFAAAGATSHCCCCSCFCCCCCSCCSWEAGAALLPRLCPPPQATSNRSVGTWPSRGKVSDPGAACAAGAASAAARAVDTGAVALSVPCLACCWLSANAAAGATPSPGGLQQRDTGRGRITSGGQRCMRPLRGEPLDAVAVAAAWTAPMEPAWAHSAAVCADDLEIVITSSWSSPAATAAGAAGAGVRQVAAVPPAHAASSAAVRVSRDSSGPDKAAAGAALVAPTPSTCCCM